MKKLKNNQFERMKKGAVVTLCVLMLAGSFSFCGKRGESESVMSIQYKKCECDCEIQYYRKISEKDILLLDAEKITYDELLMLSKSNKEVVKYAICDFASKVAYFNVYSKIKWPQNTCICNFPFDFSWDIPKEGIYVSFTAEEFESCRGGPMLEKSYSDIVLTSLKIKIQPK